MLVRERRGRRVFITPAGREFYEQFPFEVIVRVPVLRVKAVGTVELPSGVEVERLLVGRALPPNDYLPLDDDNFMTCAL